MQMTKRLISQLECCLVWNETNSPAAGKPNSDNSKEAVKNVLQQLDADIYMRSKRYQMMLYLPNGKQMNDYSFVLSEATSSTTPLDLKQK
jgi:hypothetical protein